MNTDVQGREFTGRFVVVLDRPQDAVNIGAVVRAMKNMGFAQLRLVQPRPYSTADLARVAHHAEDVIDQIGVYSTLDAALADATYIVGTSAITSKGRTLRRDLQTLGAELVRRAGVGQVALLFGTEDDGLNAAALDRCHTIVALPTNPAYPALNLAQSVLLFLYELNCQRHAAAITAPAAAPANAPVAAPVTAPTPAEQPPAAPPVPQATLEQLFLRTEGALTAIDFFKYDPPSVMRTLRQLAYRAELRAEEAALLLAIARQVVYAVKRPEKDGPA